MKVWGELDIVNLHTMNRHAPVAHYKQTHFDFGGLCNCNAARCETKHGSLRKANNNSNNHFPEVSMFEKENIRGAILFVMAGCCPECLCPGVQDLIKHDKGFAKLLESSRMAKTYAGGESDEVKGPETDQVGRVIEDGLVIPVKTCQRLFPQDRLFQEGNLDSDQLSCSTVNKIILSGRERFKSVIVPKGFYRTDGGEFVKVLSCISVGLGELPKSRKKRKLDNTLRDRLNIVDCQVFRLEDGKFEDIYEVLVSSRTCLMPAGCLARPEHILRHCTREDCPGSVVNQGECSHREEVVYLLNPFFLK